MRFKLKIWHYTHGINLKIVIFLKIGIFAKKNYTLILSFTITL